MEVLHGLLDTNAELRLTVPQALDKPYFSNCVVPEKEEKPLTAEEENKVGPVMCRTLDSC